MTSSERSQLQLWYQVGTATILFCLLVQLPLTVKYWMLYKQDPAKHLNLRTRIFLMPFVFIPYKFAAVSLE